MVIGKVVGTTVSTRKYNELQGFKLLVIQNYYGNKKEYFVAADALGAGLGQLVLVTFGDTTQFALEKKAPIDALVVGIIDSEPKIDK